MSFQLLTNTVWRDTAQLMVTDSANALSADGTNIENVTRGARHLEANVAGTATRRIAYVNKRGILAANACVICRADRLSSGYTLRKYSAYSATATTIEGTGSAPTPLIGLNGQDYFTSFTLASSQQAFSLEHASSSAKIFNKVCFGVTVDFSYDNPAQIAPMWGSIQVGRRTYLVREHGFFSFTSVPLATVQALNRSYKLQDEPCFLYETTGTILADKLWHCVIGQYSAVPTFSDFFTVQFEAYRLREYPSVT